MRQPRAESRWSPATNTDAIARITRAAVPPGDAASLRNATSPVKEVNSRLRGSCRVIPDRLSWIKETRKLLARTLRLKSFSTCEFAASSMPLCGSIASGAVSCLISCCNTEMTSAVIDNRDSCKLACTCWRLNETPALSAQIPCERRDSKERSMGGTKVAVRLSSLPATKQLVVRVLHARLCSVEFATERLIAFPSALSSVTPVPP